MDNFFRQRLSIFLFSQLAIGDEIKQFSSVHLTKSRAINNKIMTNAANVVRNVRKIVLLSFIRKWNFKALEKFNSKCWKNILTKKIDIIETRKKIWRKYFRLPACFRIAYSALDWWSLKKMAATMRLHHIEPMLNPGGWRHRHWNFNFCVSINIYITYT